VAAVAGVAAAEGSGAADGALDGVPEAALLAGGRARTVGPASRELPTSAKTGAEGP
jgi:hypothetical protein